MEDRLNYRWNNINWRKSSEEKKPDTMESFRSTILKHQQKILRYGKNKIVLMILECMHSPNEFRLMYNSFVESNSRNFNTL